MSIRLKLYPIVSRVAAVVLLLAGSLKVHQALTASAADAPPPTMLLLAVFELLFGLWLLGGLYPRGSRVAALLCFAVFFNAASLQLLQSVPSCGCFGTVQIQTAVTLTLDSLMVLALLLSSPMLESRPPATGAWLRLTMGILSIAAMLGLIGWQVMLAFPSHPAPPPAAIVQDNRPAPLLERVIQGVEQNHAALHSLTCTLDVMLTTYSRPQEAAAHVESAEKVRAVPRTQRLVMTSTICGDDLRRDCETRLADFDAREIRVDAGGKRVQYLPELQQAWLSEATSRAADRAETIDLRCAGFYPPIRSIADWLKKVELLDATVSQEGTSSEVIHLRVLAQGIGGLKDEVALDCVSTRNYLPSRIVYRFYPEGSVFSVADLEYQQVPAGQAWVPKKWTARSFLRGSTLSADAANGFDQLAETEVRSLSINPEVSAEVFDPILPPKTRLVGNLAAQPRTGDAPIRASAVMSNEPIERHAVSPKDASPFYWLLAGIDATAMGLCLIFRRQLAL